MARRSTLRGPRTHQLRRRRHARGLLASVLLLALLLAGGALAAACGRSADEGGQSGGDSPRTLTVFAAASLTDAFTRLGADYEAAHPGVTVNLNFAGSQDLIAQLEQAAPADVLATADTASMDRVADLVGDPAVFAHNRLAIAVAPGNPAGIASLADLADPDLKVVLAAPEVPAGKYAQQVLGAAGVEVSPVSLEESVKGVVTKVSLGEADAGIVYVTDVTAADGAIDGVDIPADVNVAADYPIATVAASGSADDAQAFVDLALSAEGQKTMASFGFLPPEQP
jgi:molybdate transport system substrate-binding protein